MNFQKFNLDPVTTFALLACFMLIGGCSVEPVGTSPSDNTTTPSLKQIQYCRDVMYINPELDLQPLGYYYTNGDQGESIYLKFIVNTADVGDIFFQLEPVSFRELKALESVKVLGHINEKWWDPAEQSLIGADFVVPPPGSNGSRDLNIGISDNGNGTFTVYVHWFEI